MATNKIPVIALDSGHGENTPGKRTPDGIHEWTLNDKVRDYVVEYLKDYDVKFIFPDNNEGKKDESLSSRKAMYVNKDVDAAVSIHHNAHLGKWGSANGVEIYVDKNNISADMKLAEAIYKNLPKYTGLKSRGIKKADWTVINQNSVPAVLVEGGFMDNKNDHKVITSAAGQKAYAKAVAEGLIEFLGLKKKKASTTVKKETSKETPVKSASNDTVKAWQKAAIKDGFKFPEYGADGLWGSECESVAEKAIVKMRISNKKYVYKYPNLTKIVQKAVGVTVDGDCGPKTDKAIIAYQKKHGLPADGDVGLKTWKKILGV